MQSLLGQFSEISDSDLDLELNKNQEAEIPIPIPTTILPPTSTPILKSDTMVREVPLDKKKKKKEALEIS